jgi:hypothetical protein
MLILTHNSVYAWSLQTVLMTADGYICCTQSENGFVVEMFAEDGKAVCKKHLKAALTEEDTIQVGIFHGEWLLSAL